MDGWMEDELISRVFSIRYTKTVVFFHEIFVFFLFYVRFSIRLGEDRCAWKGYSVSIEIGLRSSLHASLTDGMVLLDGFDLIHLFRWSSMPIFISGYRSNRFSMDRSE